MTVHPKFRTCDTCRKRKTRCVEISPTPDNIPTNETRCTTCTRLQVPCTYSLGYKKAGRPRSFAFDRSSGHHPNGTISPRMKKPQDLQMSGNINHDRRQSEPGTSNTRHSPRLWTDSAPQQQTQIQSPAPAVSFSFEDLMEWPSAPPANILSVESGISGGTSSSIDLGISPVHPLPGSTPDQRIDPNASTHSLPDSEPTAVNIASRLSTSINNAIESVAPWPTILDFVNIFLRYSQTLFPLIHVPTFCKALATRKDKTDRDFAALILGIVAYTIGQLPLSRFTPQYSRNQLLSLQRRCHSASMSLVDRHYKTVSTDQIATLMTAYFYCQSIGKTNQAVAVLAEACQLTHLLCLGTQDDGADCVARELQRRVFWHVYAVDTTEACSGHMIHLNSFEGYPPLPLDVDDEFITTRGAFPQSPGAVSSLTGFIGVVQLFPYIADILVRQRRLQQRLRQGKILSPEEVNAERAWMTATRLAVDEYMCNLPVILRAVGDNDPTDPVRRAVVGMQRANILVTEASLRLTLLDYALEVEPASQALANEKTLVARTALEVLSALPLEDLASNGESMRGKICRILYHLLRNGDLFDDQTMTSLHGWCNLYSAVHFVQLSKNDLEGLLLSRQPSPVLA